MMKTREVCGLNEKHSEWMKKHNPYSGTIWVNDGKEDLRCYPSEIPAGFNKGRLFRRGSKEYKCPHCNKIGKGPNMKRYHFDNCKQTVDF